MNFNPKNDGVEHINVYSKAKTELGRKLSNFAYSPFFCEDGKFNSIEGYWYWLRAHEVSFEKREKLRDLSGYAAKKYGRELGCKDWPRDEQELFRRKIKAAFDKKLESNPEISKMLIESELPFVHYYLYGGEKVVYDGRSDWLMEYIEEVRKELKNFILHDEK